MKALGNEEAYMILHSVKLGKGMHRWMLPQIATV